MAKETKIEYQVTLTFDVDAKGDSSVYEQISELLESQGLSQSIGDSDLPENLYFGIRVGKTSYEGEVLLQSDIKARADLMSQYYWKLVHDFFETKKLKHKIFVITSRRSTSAVRRSK
ncbi:TPA: hypothetical protein ACTXAG_003147 [Klebsiella oxytoca]|nr:hypothetical protein [Klebsiella oxytoca]HEI8759235.1 hypothetical protein [Klebsiella oxytoca]